MIHKTLNALTFQTVLSLFIKIKSSNETDIFTIRIDSCTNWLRPQALIRSMKEFM